MDRTKYWSSERTKKKQTALTRLGNGLKSEVMDDPATSELFNEDELQTIRIASELLRRARTKFEHIKEKKKREELKKKQEKDNIDRTCKRYAKMAFDAVNPNSELFSSKLLLLWLTVAKHNKLYAEPEDWEFDINDNVSHHYLDSDDSMRHRNAFNMKHKALESFEQFLSKAWSYSFATDSYVSVLSIDEAYQQLLNLTDTPSYHDLAVLHASKITQLEAFNRSIEAIERRKSIKSIK